MLIGVSCHVLLGRCVPPKRDSDWSCHLLIFNCFVSCWITTLGFYSSFIVFTVETTKIYTRLLSVNP